MAETVEKEQAQEQKEMRMYQLFYILPSALTPEEILHTRDELTEDLTKGGAHILGSREPIKKRLAYPIRNQQYGFMGEMNFWAKPSSLSSFSLALRRNEHITRFSLAAEEKEDRRMQKHERSRAYAHAVATDSAAHDTSVPVQESQDAEAPALAPAQEQQARTFKDKISLQEIDKKLEEIMKSI